MRVCITGSSGLIGSRLIPLLTAGGAQVVRLVRGGPTADSEAAWGPRTGEVDSAAVGGADAVVHLAGENIAGGRWTAARKALIRDSRVDGTRALCESLARMQDPPRVLVCASAIGFYGDRGGAALDEVSEQGEGFLPDVCRAWEQATEPASAAGLRVVNLRFGIVLSARGGALTKMLLPFRMGLGGRVGRGDQYWSWVSVDDAAGAIHQSIVTDSLQGPVNAVAPNPVTNLEFTKILGQLLHRPTVFPMPALAARVTLGEMANELLLASARVLPKRLQESGYDFRHPTLEGALRHVLDAPA